MEKFTHFIEEELERRGWSRADLARASGISQSMLSHIWAGTRNPGTEVCEGIARAFKMPPETVYRAAGLLPPVAREDELTAEILHLAGKMTPEELEEYKDYARMKLARRSKKNSNVLVPIN